MPLVVFQNNVKLQQITLRHNRLPWSSLIIRNHVVLARWESMCGSTNALRKIPIIPNEH